MPTARFPPIWFFFFLSAFFQTTVGVNENRIEFGFPDVVRFRIDVQANVPIDRVTLLYGTDGRACQNSVARQDLELEPGTRVADFWEWELKRSGTLPPGVEVWWQWEIETETGEIHTTPMQTAVVQDPRYEWNAIERDGIIVQWYLGDLTFGDEIHQIAADSLRRIEQDFGISYTDEIHLTLYASASEVRDAVFFVPNWTGGVAFPEFNAAIIGIGPTDLEWAKRVIPHELAHLVVGVVTFNCKGAYLPTWLNEGLATVVEGSLDDDERQLVIAALENQTLPRLVALENQFSAYGDSASLSYIQSGMVVQYLLDEFGPKNMAGLLATIQSGEPIEAALQTVYGFDTNELDMAWRASLGFEADFDMPQVDEAQPSPTPIPTLSLMNPGFPSAPTETPPPQPTASPTATASPLLTPTPRATTTPPVFPTASAFPDSISATSRPLFVPAIIAVGVLFTIGVGFFIKMKRR